MPFNPPATIPVLTTAPVLNKCTCRSAGIVPGCFSDSSKCGPREPRGNRIRFGSRRTVAIAPERDVRGDRGKLRLLRQFDAHTCTENEKICIVPSRRCPEQYAARTTHRVQDGRFGMRTKIYVTR